MLSVADLGVGLLNSLKKGLKEQGHHLANAKDNKLILEMFNNGLSSKGELRGTGLNRAAEIAIKYQGNLHVRLDKYIIDLRPIGTLYALASLSPDCTKSVGTHITFTFSVPNL